MEGDELIRKTRGGAVVKIDREVLDDLLGTFETIRAEQTGIAGWIRVLAVEGSHIVEEETPDGEILVRGFESHGEADAFVESRLADYDRMWDGCGCTIDYSGPACA